MTDERFFVICIMIMAFLASLFTFLEKVAK